MFFTKSPVTEEVLENYNYISDQQLEFCVLKAQQSFEVWQNQAIQKRQKLFLNLSSVLLQKQKNLASLITQEMGKPILQARAEIEKCASICQYYAQNAAAFLQDQIIPTEYKKSFVTFVPLGVIFAIMPWNFPFWQVFRAAVPIVIAGNTLLLKHAPQTTACALAIQQLFLDAGFDEYIFQTLIISHQQSDELICKKEIKGVTLTGSTRAGREVARVTASVLKKTVLELGGNDAYVILDDADIDLAAKTCLESRFNNSGQVCIAAKRIIVTEKNHAVLQQKLLELLPHFKMGDPFLEETQIGPLAREDLRSELHRQVQQSVAQGAVLLAGGFVSQEKGWYYPPTFLSHVEPHMVAFREELFGPVIVLIVAPNEDQALRLANDSDYGLGAVVFTQNEKRGEELAVRYFQAGSCFVNTLVKSDVRLPFGGIKDSGYGRELSYFGLYEFMNIKTVCMAR